MASETSMSIPPSQQPDDNHSTTSALPCSQAAAFWRSCLTSGLRDALACIIVGVVSFYSPPALRQYLTFPAFSFVVTVIIVTDASLGRVLCSAVSALYATFIGALPSVLALWLAHRTGVSVMGTTAVVALSTFALALPDSLGPVGKRIALGQIVIIYVGKFKQGEHPSHAHALLHPAHVVACTTLGVFAALVAVLLPFPRLATHEVSRKRKVYMEMAVERVRVLVEGFCANKRWCMASCASQAEYLTSTSTATALLQHIHPHKGDLKWERPPAAVLLLLKWLQPHVCTGLPLPLEDKLKQNIEMPLKGMEIALRTMTCTSSTSQAPLAIAMNSNDLIMHLRDRVSLALLRHNYYHHHYLTKATMDKALTFPPSVIVDRIDMPQSHKDLAPFFFLFSMKLLHHGTLTLTSTPANAGQDRNIKIMPTSKPTSTDSSEEEEDDEEQVRKRTMSEKNNNVCLVGMRRERLVAALKCAFMLGLAILLGLLFSRESGYWSGLIVATTMTPHRESTWVLAIARAHGTALGSVYGVLGCLISQHLMELRFIALVLWIVLASFLKRSRVYGPAGSIAAVLSAIIIMGRRYYDPPMAFTIARLVETFIGLSCIALSDLVFQPIRPSTLARAQLSCCLSALRGCIVATDPSNALIKEHKRLQEQIGVLKKHATEAGDEPNLWFMKFPKSCYDKLHGSLTKMMQLVYFQARAMENMRELCHRAGVPWEEVQEKLHIDMEQFRTSVSVYLQCLEEIAKIIIKSSPMVREFSDDLEAGGKVQDRDCRGSEEDLEALEMVVGSFLGHAKEAIRGLEGEQAVVCMACVGFCMEGLMREARELEAAMLELLQCQNPGTRLHVDEIWCRVKAAAKR